MTERIKRPGANEGAVGAQRSAPILDRLGVVRTLHPLLLRMERLERPRIYRLVRDVLLHMDQSGLAALTPSDPYREIPKPPKGSPVDRLYTQAGRIVSGFFKSPEPIPAVALDCDDRTLLLTEAFEGRLRRPVEEAEDQETMDTLRGFALLALIGAMADGKGSLFEDRPYIPSSADCKDQMRRVIISWIIERATPPK